MIFNFSLLAHALQIEPVFNAPGFGSESANTLEQKLIDMINQTPPGATIHMAIHNYLRAPLSLPLLYASARGVSVEMVFDGKNEKISQDPSSAIGILINGTQDGEHRLPPLKCEPGVQCVKICTGSLKSISVGGGCNGFGIQHNKFVLFSHLNEGRGITENVYVQMSGNITESQLSQHNDMMIFRNNSQLYQLMRNKFKQLQSNVSILYKLAPTHQITQGLDQQQSMQVQFFPTSQQIDPVVQYLNRVNCRLANSSIKLAQSVFTRKAVAEKLVQLRSQGCHLTVFSRIDEKQQSPSPLVIKLLGDDLILIPFQSKILNHEVENSVHSKLILIDASIDNSYDKRNVVIAGSHNLDLPSLLANDETLNYVEDRKVYEMYLAFWTKMVEEVKERNLPVSNQIKQQLQTVFIDPNLSSFDATVKYGGYDYPLVNVHKSARKLVEQETKIYEKLNEQFAKSYDDLKEVLSKEKMKLTGFQHSVTGPIKMLITNGRQVEITGLQMKVKIKVSRTIKKFLFVKIKAKCEFEAENLPEAVIKGDINLETGYINTVEVNNLAFNRKMKCSSNLSFIPFLGAKLSEIITKKATKAVTEGLENLGTVKFDINSQVVDIKALLLNAIENEPENSFLRSINDNFETLINSGRVLLQIRDNQSVKPGVPETQFKASFGDNNKEYLGLELIRLNN